MEELNVIFEDNHIIVVLKPQNIPSQADDSKDMDLLSMVKEYLKVKYDKAGSAFAGLVHRLDRPTGGVMVFAKTSKAAARLAESITEGDFEKKYFAVLVGSPREKQGRLSHFLWKNTANNMVEIVPQSTDGAKRAELQYKIISDIGKISLCDIQLLTGRTHQARVQMKSMGTPIFGDVRYGGDTLAKGHNLALWAYDLRFPHPVTKEIMVFKVEPPIDTVPWKHFEAVLAPIFKI